MAGGHRVDVVQHAEQVSRYHLLVPGCVGVHGGNHGK